ncbi:MAG TPA: tetratricopeptide repeat protein [Candidatus Polarisedimenticolia bacterium]|nr:tetratricopeptide repeat protein [Candidatus Polarisedimenticolia bacterium]
MRILRTVCSLTLVVLAAGVAAGASEDQDMYAKGRSAVFEERWDDARKILEELTRRFPASPYADDAYWWTGMALYETGQAERAYAILKELDRRFPDSRWSEDARALRVRCAERALMASSGGKGSRSIGRYPVRTDGGGAEYEAFIEQSTHDASAKVQLLAIDTMLTTRPDKASELLPRLNSGFAPKEAADIVLDRYFGGERVKVSVQDPSRGLDEGNVAVMVRQGDDVVELRLAEAVDIARGGSNRRFDEATRAEILSKILETERSLVRSGDPGTVEAVPIGAGDRTSAIVKVVDGEVHYYRNGGETIQILVLRRSAGFTAENVRIFVETPTGVRQLDLGEARHLAPDGARAGLNEASSRYLKAALAIIELDLAREPAGR